MCCTLGVATRWSTIPTYTTSFPAAESSWISLVEEIRVIVWMALGWIYWLASGHAPRAKSKAVPPFRCSHCRGRMQVCEVVFQAVCLQQLNQPPATIDSS